MKANNNNVYQFEERKRKAANVIITEVNKKRRFL